MNRKSFEALPKAAQDAIREHSLDWINKLYDRLHACLRQVRSSIA